jgi:DNA-binding FadR family transcriptional regulator
MTTRSALSAGHAPLLIKRERLADQVYEMILRRIIEGHYPLESRLPSESIFAVSLDVSRPIVREALARLRSDGIVSSRRGAGTFVNRKPASEFARLAPVGDIADVMRCYELRIGTEGEAARVAARMRSRAALRAIREALRDLDDAVATGAVGADADCAFHYAVAHASTNRFFVSALELVDRHMRAGIRLARELSRLQKRTRLQIVQEEHRAVYAAIADQDEAQAALTMRAHIANSRDRMVSDRDGTEGKT